MANLTVTDAVTLDVSAYPDIFETRQTVVVQNLGPGALYMDFVSSTDDLTVDSGIKLVVDGIWEIQEYDSARPLVLMSDGTSDVRITALD